VIDATDQVTRNKATLAWLNSALNGGDLHLISAAIDEAFEPDVQIGTPLPSGASGAEALKQVWAALLRAYPDLHVAVEDLVAEGDTIASRHTVTGTHLGEHLGVAPTGRPVTYSEMFFVRFDHGRITHTWGVVDILAQLKQLGAFPG